MDKAGSYGIQDPFGLYAVSEINGSYTNVMGLPCKCFSFFGAAEWRKFPGGAVFSV